MTAAAQSMKRLLPPMAVFGAVLRTTAAPTGRATPDDAAFYAQRAEYASNLQLPDTPRLR
jgi:hypothetical protein